MQVAAQHAETERQRAGPHVEKRLLLDGVALDAADVAPGDVESPAAVEAHLANARLSLQNGTLVAAGIAPDAGAIQRLPQHAFLDMLGQDFSLGGHPSSPLPIIPPPPA